MVGNIPNFTKIDILRCLLRFNKNISRQELARELELGEGTVRSILEDLKSKKFLGSTKKGHFLSSKGHEMLLRIYGLITAPKEIKLQDTYPDSKKVGVVVRDALSLKGLYKIRDIAVKNGADGAIILKFENRLYAPESNYEQSYEELESNFDFKNNDVLAIAFSNKKRHAENGALAIAVELNNKLKKIVDEF